MKKTTESKMFRNVGLTVRILGYDDFDIIIDLNIHFIFEISMFIQQLKSKYKIGFVSNYSDFFYNIQLQTDRNNPSYKSLDYLLGKI